MEEIISEAEVTPEDALTRRDFLRRGVTLGAAVPLLGGIAAACGSTAGSTTTTSAPATKPRRGGDLKVGLTGGSSSENLDANNSVGYPANMRCAELYDPLTKLNSKVQSEYVLAEEITPNSTATVWTIRLRSGVTFHNGKDLTADDVIYTFQRIVNPKFPLAGATALGPIDAKNMKKLDPLTVQVPMTAPFASFIEQLGTTGTSISCRSATIPTTRLARDRSSFRAAHPAFKASSCATRTTGNRDCPTWTVRPLSTSPTAHR